MAGRYDVDDFNGPQEAVRRLTNLKDSHAFYCRDCLALKYGRSTEPCPVADVYDRSVAAARALYETQRIPDGA